MRNLIILIVFSTFLFAEYSFRKYEHVKKFYKGITEKTIELGLKYNIPPSAVLAIAGLESGFGNGYVAKITGNILSLGARSGEKELPPITVAVDKITNEVLLCNDKIISNPNIEYQERPASLKKDYRPYHLAGTTIALDFFEKNQNLKEMAYIQNINDFMSSWISTKSKVKAFKDAKIVMDSLVKVRGKEVLFDYETNVMFINLIGGKPHSFNYRTSWVDKVVKVLDKTGLVDITSDIYHHNNDFIMVWEDY